MRVLGSYRALQWSIFSIFNDHFGTRKQSGNWMPHLLSIDHKRTRVITLKECLMLFNPKLGRISEHDDTWIDHNRPETQ